MNKPRHHRKPVFWISQVSVGEIAPVGREVVLRDAVTGGRPLNRATLNYQAAQMALGNIRAENVEQLTLKSGVSMTFEAGALEEEKKGRTHLSGEQALIAFSVAMDAVLLVGGTAVPGGLMGLRLRALADAHPDLMAHVVARRGLGFRALLRRGEIGGDVVQGLDEVPAAACAFCICAWRAFNSVASAANCTV